MDYENEYLWKSEIFFKEAKEAYSKGIYWLACFHAHQSIEFYLKGILEIKAGAYPFTHDLKLLLKTYSSMGINIPEDLLMKAELLTPHYTLARYGGKSVFEYNEERAKNCINYAEEILNWLKKTL